MSRLGYWIFLWRRHWGSAFHPTTKKRFPGIARMHRDALVHMLVHPLKSTRRYR